MLKFKSLKFKSPTKEIQFQANYLSNYKIMCVQGNLLALSLYALFSILDLFALPNTRIYSFGIRIVEMLVLGTYAFSINKNMIHIKQINSVMIFVGIIVGTGINAMIFFSQPTELGYSTYYAGLCLVILWLGFYFRGNMQSYYVGCLVITGIYLLIVIMKQEINFEIIINNLFFILSTIFLASLYRYHSEKVYRENFNAFLEVNELKNKLNKQKELILTQKKEISNLIPQEVKSLILSKTAKHLEKLNLIKKLMMENKVTAEELLMLACLKLEMTDEEMHENHFPTKSVRVIKNHFSKIKNKLGLESRKDIKKFLDDLE